jgi:LacI family transcriptional regulator
VSDATREKIRKVATEMGYVANPIARGLATGKTRSLGLVLPYAEAFLDQNPFCSQVMFGVMKEAVHRHYNVMMFTAAGGLDKGSGPMIDSRVDGMLLVMPAAQSPTIDRLKHQRIPHVSVLREVVDDGWIVNSDDRGGGRLAAEHLLSLGHRRIAHLAGTSDIATSQPRARGFAETLEAAGHPLEPGLIIESGFSTESGYAAMRQLLYSVPTTDLPSAVFAANDLCADGAMRAITEFGLGIPDDIAVVGYDDTWFAGLTHPPLTSIHMPIAEMGETAAAMLIDHLEGMGPAETQPTLPVSLTIRTSCGGVAGTSGDAVVSPIPSMRN